MFLSTLPTFKSQSWNWTKIVRVWSSAKRLDVNVSTYRRRANFPRRTLPWPMSIKKMCLHRFLSSSFQSGCIMNSVVRVRKHGVVVVCVCIFCNRSFVENPFERFDSGWSFRKDNRRESLNQTKKRGKPSVLPWFDPPMHKLESGWNAFLVTRWKRLNNLEGYLKRRKFTWHSNDTRKNFSEKKQRCTN